MNPVTLVTIGIRALGLVLVLWHAGGVARLVMFALFHLFGRIRIDPVELLLGVGASGAPESLNLALFAFGLYLFFSGRWVISRLTRGLSWPGGGTCARCGYDVSAVESGRCPECGTKLPVAPRP
jgi:hypothetical protein